MAVMKVRVGDQWVMVGTEQGISSPYATTTDPPSDTKLLWIDPNTTEGGLKYYNISTSKWTHVPVAYT